MRKILLTAGLATAVIFGVQAQESPNETKKEKQLPQEEMIEARGDVVEETYESEDNMQRTSAEATFGSEDLASINEADLPKEVMKNFENSDFSQGSLDRAYEIDGAAMPQILEARANLSMYAGEQLPEKLYILHVSNDQGKGILYIGNEGESIAEEEILNDDATDFFGEAGEETANGIDKTAYETKKAVENADYEMEEADNETENSVENAAYKSEEAMEKTSNEIENATERTEAKVAEATYETENAIESSATQTKEGWSEAKVEEATTETEAFVEGTATEANHETNEAAQEVDEETTEMTQAVEYKTSEAAEAVEETVEQAEENVENAVENTDEAIEESVESDAYTKNVEMKNSSSSFNSKDMSMINKSDLPQLVKDGFSNSAFGQGTIEKVYEMTGSVVGQILQDRAAMSIYAGEQLPETLYQIQVSNDNGAGVLYIGDDGEIIASENL